MTEDDCLAVSYWEYLLLQWHGIAELTRQP